MSNDWKHFAVSISLAFAWAGVAALAAGASTPADSAKSTAKTKSSANVMSDSDFAKAAAEGGVAEVRFGELAEDKASSKTVKDLAERMVTDHTKSDDSLKTAASKEGISIPAQLNAKDQAAYTRLSQLSGAAFDRAYTRDLVRDHETDIALFRHEANEGKDASMKSFATETLPTLQDHLKMARQALDSVSPKTSAKGTNKQS
jgi:putative membrane protein